MMKINHFKVILCMVTMIIASTGISQTQSSSRLIETELQKVDTAAGIVVFNNQQYRYQVDLENAQYQDEDQEKLINIRELKEGEQYIFNLYKSDDSANNQYKLIFIAQEPRAE